MDNHSGTLTMNIIPARKELERFIVENDDLLTLESHIGKFNIFDALCITHTEIRHSNFLAFILDPAESHGQGQLFLKAMLMDILKQAPPELRPLSPIDLDGIDLRGVEVRREWKNIDLLIICKEPSFLIVVENKVASREHSDQLSRYQKIIADQYPDLPTLFIYLTLDGEEPSSDSWMPYTYSDIYRVFKRIRQTYQNAIGNEVRIFLDHYINLLGTRFMNDDDPELDALCRQIYKNHRRAIEMIWARVGSSESGPMGTVLDVLKNDNHWNVLYENRRFIDFVPASWLKWLPSRNSDNEYPFGINLWNREGALAFMIFVGPLTNGAVRSVIVASLRDKLPELGFKRSKSNQLTGKWSRVAAPDVILEWDEDCEFESTEFRQNVKVKLDALHSRLISLEPILVELFGPATSDTEPSRAKIS